MTQQTRDRWKLVVASAFALAVAACGGSAPPPAQPDLTIQGAKSLKNSAAVVFALIVKEGGKCVAKLHDKTAYTSPQQIIQWIVYNGCGEEVQDVHITFDATDPTVHGKLAIKKLGSDDTKEMVAIVKDKGDVNETSYKYSFYVNGTAQDPDIVIEFDPIIIKAKVAIPGRR